MHTSNFSTVKASSKLRLSTPDTEPPGTTSDGSNMNFAEPKFLKSLSITFIAGRLALNSPKRMPRD
jgi:hypothetical protein